MRCSINPSGRIGLDPRGDLAADAGQGRRLEADPVDRLVDRLAVASRQGSLRIGLERRDQRRIAATSDKSLHEARPTRDVDQLVHLGEMSEHEIDREALVTAGDRS